MNRIKFTSTVITGVLATFLILSGCESESYENAELDSSADSVSYALGFLNGQRMAQRGMDTIEPELFASGMQQAMAEDSSLLDQRQMMTLLRNYQAESRERMMESRMEQAEQNTEEAEEFLAENETEEGVQTTESGLQYKVLEEGSGASPTAEDSVTVHYEGTLLNGEVFDSSYQRGQPATFPLNEVIEGWTEGVQLMEEGAVYKFWVPGDLAYGPDPRAGGPIGPNELLIFEVELIEVN